MYSGCPRASPRENLLLRRRRNTQKLIQSFVVWWMEYLQRLQDTYPCYKNAKEMWDTLNIEYGGSDASAELYIIELYHNYQMVDGKCVITQAHEIQCMVKELRLLRIVILDKFMAGGIIAKLPPSWRDFATALKHKKVHMSISDLITSLDVEEKV
jgi:hypothetical protein